MRPSRSRVPTFVLVAGGSVAAALMPGVLPLRAVFYPLSLVLLGITLVLGGIGIEDERFLHEVRILIQDCVNQGGITNLRITAACPCDDRQS